MAKIGDGEHNEERVEQVEEDNDDEEEEDVQDSESEGEDEGEDEGGVDSSAQDDNVEDGKKKPKSNGNSGKRSANSMSSTKRNKSAWAELAQEIMQTGSLEGRMHDSLPVFTCICNIRQFIPQRRCEY